MKSFLVAILFLMAFTANPQANLDSLWTVWENTDNPDSSRFDALQTYAWNGFLYTNPDSALSLGDIYFEEAQRKGDFANMGVASTIRGGAYTMLGLFDSALVHYYKGLDYNEQAGNYGGMAASYNNIGLIFQYRLDYSKAIDCYNYSVKIQLYLGNDKEVAGAYHNIALIYRTLDEEDVALGYLTKALNAAEGVDDPVIFATVYSSLGGAYDKIGDPDSARYYFNKSYDIAVESGNLYGQGTVLNSLGAMESQQGNNELALQFLFKSKSIREQLGARRDLTYALTAIGGIYLAMDRLDSAKYYSALALDMSQEIGENMNVYAAAENLYEIFKIQGQDLKALEMYELCVETNELIESDENERAIVAEQLRGDFDKKEAIEQTRHDLELERQNEAAEASEKINSIIIAAVSVGLLLVLLFLVFLYNRFRLIRSQKNIIEEQKHEVEVKNNEILDSINYAKRIQKAILPQDHLVESTLPENFVLYKPKDVVAGDFYWLEEQDGKVMIAAADCTGHGVPGAMVSVVCHNALNRAVREFNLTDPGLILDKVREIILEEFEKSEEDVRDGMDIAIATLDKNQLSFSGAHNPLWIVRKGGEEIEEIRGDKQPVGKFEFAKPFTSHEVKLEVGDTVYLFSDGYVDQFGGDKGKKFKSANLKKLILSIKDLSMKDQCDRIDEVFENWRGENEQVDDVCFIGIRL